MDDEPNYSGNKKGNARAVAAAVTKLTKTILTKLACNLTGTDTGNL
jgi:hypothetical protein